MRKFSAAVGSTLILSGIALGLCIALYFASIGMAAVKDGQITKGLLSLLLWSEVLGIVASLSLVIPGILVLRRLGGKPNPRRQAP